MAPSERYEVVIDFCRYPVGSRVYLLNCLQQLSGRGPERINMDSCTPLVEFRIARDEADPSTIPDDLVPGVATVHQRTPDRAAGAAGPEHRHQPQSRQRRLADQRALLRPEPRRRGRAAVDALDLDPGQRKRRTGPIRCTSTTRSSRSSRATGQAPAPHDAAQGRVQPRAERVVKVAAYWTGDQNIGK